MKSIKTHSHLILIMLTGCSTSYHINESRYAHEQPNYEKSTVYITNPDHNAYALLKTSEIYNLTDNKENPVKLTLIENKDISSSCGMGSIASMFSLGIIADSYPISENFIYALNENGKTTTYNHIISYSQSTSLLDTLSKPFTKSKDETRKTALSSSARITCENIKQCAWLK